MFRYGVSFIIMLVVIQMNLKLFISIVIIFQAFLAHSQSDSLEGQWLGENDVDIRFNSSKISSRKYSYFSSYQVIKDTLYITHDYEGIGLYTIDSLGNKIEMKNWKLPNSKFQIVKVSEMELVLYPLNPSAMKIAGEIRQPHVNYSLESYQKLLDQKESANDLDSNESKEIKINYDYNWFGSASIDTIKLQSAKALYSTIEFDSIAISYFSQGWFARYYYDLKLYNDGLFVVNHERDGSDTGEFENIKAILGLFEGSISLDEISEINQLLSSSGISKLESKDYEGWTSHGNYICIKVYYNHTFKELKGIQGMFPIMIEPIIRQLLAIDDFENYEQIDRDVLFETSYKK